MKRTEKALMTILMALTLSACGKETNKPTSTAESKPSASEVEPNSKNTDSTDKKESTQESFTLDIDAILLKGIGDSYDIRNCYTTTAENLVSYKAEDPSLISIDSNGTIKALKDEGSTTILLKFKEETYTIDVVCVYDYMGVYGASKRVEAMGCDIKVQPKLMEDGIFEFYRGKMVIQALGEAIEESSVEIIGNYAVKSAQIEFRFDEEYADVGFYTFNLDFALDEDSGARLSGYIPTGGPMTDFILLSGVTAKDKE